MHPPSAPDLPAVTGTQRWQAMPLPRLPAADRLGFCMLALALAWLGWDTARRAGHALSLSAEYGVAVDAPAFDPASPTGYRDGRRSLLVPTGAADGAHWVMQTQSQLARGDLRTRSVDYDNAPHGREVHWASPLRWWLASLAWVDSTGGNHPLGAGVERAALWSGPVMFALALPLLFFWVRRTVSPWAAACVPLVAMSYHPFAIDFLAGRADHHGLANLAAFAAVLAFAAGDLRRNPHWYRLSALAAAAGMWISAVTVLPVLAGLGLGLLGSAVAFRRADRPPPWLAQPLYLRQWAGTGALASLVFYFLETLPGPFPLRLEVNHPWYALAWWGAGEVLAFVVGRWRNQPLPRAGLRAALGLAAALSLPAIVLASRADTYKVVDPFLFALHREHIAEFQPLVRIASTQGFTTGVLGLFLPLLLWFAPLALLGRRTIPPEVRSTLAVLAGPALLATVLGWFQVRWLGLAFAAGLPALLVALKALEIPSYDGSPRRRQAIIGAVALLCLPGLLAAWQRTRHAGETSPEDIRHLAERDLAHWLRLRAGRSAVVLAAPPGLTTRQLYYGSHHGLGTLYWENADGLARLADFYAARTDEEARTIATEAGLTHVIFASWDAFELPLIQLRRGGADRRTTPTDSFFVRLLQAPVPPVWLRAIPFPLPAHPALQGAELRVWEVVTPRSPARAVNDALRARLESGRPDLALRLGQNLAEVPEEFASLLGQATLAAAAQDERAFVPVLRRVQSRLDEAAGLSLGERLQLVSVLALGRDFEGARHQLRQALAVSDANDVRALTTGQLGDLLSLCDALSPNDLHPYLREIARELLPPGRRP